MSGGSSIPVIAFVHHKGGTGKTTSCIQIAGALTAIGGRVLIIDTDPQANASMGLGIHPETSEKTIYDVYMGWCQETENRIRLKDCVTKTVSGIDLIPSHLDLIGAEPYLYEHPKRYQILSEEISLLKGSYSHILIDTPPFLGQFVLNAMIASDRTVLVFSPDWFAIEGYDNIKLVIDDLADILDQKVMIGMALLNRWKIEEDTEERSFLDKIRAIFSSNGERYKSKVYLQELMKRLESRINSELSTTVIIPESPYVVQSHEQGMPLSMIRPDDPAAKAFGQAAVIIDSWR